jgi:hypothetical protein
VFFWEAELKEGIKLNAFLSASECFLDGCHVPWTAIVARISIWRHVLVLLALVNVWDWRCLPYAAVILPVGSIVILSFCQHKSAWTSRIGWMRLRAVVDL